LLAKTSKKNIEARMDGWMNKMIATATTATISTASAAT
jgi:hypothetical protein